MYLVEVNVPLLALELQRWDTGGTKVGKSSAGGKVCSDGNCSIDGDDDAKVSVDGSVLDEPDC